MIGHGHRRLRLDSKLAEAVGDTADAVFAACHVEMVMFRKRELCSFERHYEVKTQFFRSFVTRLKWQVSNLLPKQSVFFHGFRVRFLSRPDRPRILIHIFNTVGTNPVWLPMHWLPMQSLVFGQVLKVRCVQILLSGGNISTFPCRWYETGTMYFKYTGVFVRECSTSTNSFELK